jgi:hypothetical protein
MNEFRADGTDASFTGVETVVGLLSGYTTYWARSIYRTVPQ